MYVGRYWTDIYNIDNGAASKVGRNFVATSIVIFMLKVLRSPAVSASEVATPPYNFDETV